MIVIQLMINVNLSWIFFTFNQYLSLNRDVIFVSNGIHQCSLSHVLTSHTMVFVQKTKDPCKVSRNYSADKQFFKQTKGRLRLLGNISWQKNSRLQLSDSYLNNKSFLFCFRFNGLNSNNELVSKHCFGYNPKGTSSYSLKNNVQDKEQILTA